MMVDDNADDDDDGGGGGGSGCDVDDDAPDVDDDDDDDGVFEWTILAAFNRHSFQTWPDPAIKKGANVGTIAQYHQHHQGASVGTEGWLGTCSLVYHHITMPVSICL